ncbi:hypothetical protein TM1040_0817 [Ruegeria sp. TM1040]|uniref:hypothetical protein n=1 Tax=Ruegeria sp. (strain TM1040) TaxID=292414 RepID=UPI0000553A98|nr:hypothetical protein [Ruegeria sp. TM1040]ABF63550.1 hypothetical protein TM1040_0817 [Ruegeria sp. TM1040]
MMDRGNVASLSTLQIDQMEERKHDTDYQLSLCRSMMEEDMILPFAFHRAAILLSKEKRFSEALDVCLYVQRWCDNAKSNWDGVSALHWESPKLKNCIERIPKLMERAQ